MCPRKNLDIPIEDLPYEKFQKIIHKLEGVKEVILTGWGEPLVHPNIHKMIEDCKDENFYVRLTTNATLLDKNLTILDSITISIDSIDVSNVGHNVDVTSKIREFALLKPRPEIVLQPMMYTEKDVLDVVKFGADIGAERINLGRLDTRFVDIDRPSEHEEKKLFKSAEKLGMKLGIHVDCVQYAVFTGIKRFLYKKFRKYLYRTKCPKTYDTCYINCKGFVTPCCNLPTYKIENFISNKDISEIWLSDKFKKFRLNQQKICGKCDVWFVRQKY
jgi:MoaA/NifB/PqqE/SkfB family radical SAM enzyme